MSFEGKVVLVTGAGQGIAEATARSFAAAGAQVAVADLVEERASQVAASIRDGGGAALGLHVDVRHGDSVRAMVDAVIGEWGKIDVLVNAAGGYGELFRATHETPDEEWDMVIDSNLKGCFLGAKHVAPHMIKAGGGRIINFSSNAGRSVSPILGCSYTAAKTAVIGLSRHLAREYAAHNILVNTIAPGPVDNPRLAHLLPTDESRADLLAQMPLGRLAQSDEIADVVLFLASDASRYMTGAVLDVNGGYVLA